MINKNNPFNIRYSPLNKWKGLIGNHKGFCEFEDLKYAIRAAATILMCSYRKRGIRSYFDIIKTYAPPAENHTAAYLTFICKTLCVQPCDEPKNVYQFARLLVRMAYFESSFVLDLKYTIFVINHFKIQVYEKD